MSRNSPGSHHPPRSSSSPWAAAWVVSLLAASALLAAPADRAKALPAPVHVDAPAAHAGHPAPDAAASGRCESCHSWESGFSHPVDVRPSMPVPAGLPLERGLLTCATCHDAADHAASPGHGAAPTPSFLRDTATGSFCTQCHTADAKSAASMHATSLGRAHYAVRKSIPRKGLATDIDRESQACMSCHDGASAADAGSHARMGDFAVARGAEHPIGVRYDPGARRGGESRLVATTQLDRRVRLYDGALGCGSCHTPFSRERKLLVVSNLGSRLCLSCHDQ